MAILNCHFRHGHRGQICLELIELASDDNDPLGIYVRVAKPPFIIAYDALGPAKWQTIHISRVDAEWEPNLAMPTVPTEDIRADETRLPILGSSIPTPTGPYVHDPILKQSNQIRLLRFVDHETILIFHTTLENAPGYRALSYTWGSEHLRQIIQVLVDIDGELQPRPLLVTKNCKDALKRLYDDDWFTPVWVDAICINQAEDQERNHQVRLMSRIYSTADKVQIDLGPGDDGIHLAFNYITNEYKFQEEGTPLKLFPYTEVAPLAIQKSLSDVLSRSWFTRIWVLQEVHFAKYAEVICGGDKIPWSILRLLGIHYYDDQSTPPSLMFEERHYRSDLSRVPRIPPILSICEDQQTDKPLWYWLEETTSLKWTDERDRVYALLGLASDIRDGTIHLAVDYTRRADEVEGLVRSQYTGLSFSLSAWVNTNPREQPRTTSYLHFWNCCECSEHATNSILRDNCEECGHPRCITCQIFEMD